MSYEDLVKIKSEMVEPQPTAHCDPRMHLILEDMKRIVPEKQGPKPYPGPKIPD